jgi:hypothetical protein
MYANRQTDVPDTGHIHEDKFSKILAEDDPMQTCLSRRSTALCGMLILGAAAAPSRAVPSFARQTGMACAACHTVFPELTPFGREFKLNGYVLDNIRQIKGITLENRETLALNSIPPISLMLQVSYTHTGAALPDAGVSGALSKDGDVLFPDQASFFYAGKIADGLGAFVQLTYSGSEDHFELDNTDIRYARHIAFGGTPESQTHSLVLGVTLNNNPTVQDVWNTTPAWGFPYAVSSVAPAPSTSTKIDSGGGGIGQNTAGLGVYAWLDDRIYAEITLYTEAKRAGAVDSTQSDVIQGVSPYWRLAYEYRWDRNSLEAGVYGIQTHIHPGNGIPLQGATDRYTDTAADVQYQFIGEDHLISVLSTFIHENQTLEQSFLNNLAANPAHDLNTFKLAAEYYYQRTIGGSLAHFSTTGSVDALLYAPAPVSGSANFSPQSRGEIAELDYLPFLNTKLLLQYTHYDKFNGGSSNYDGSGRSASNNDALYAMVWINF